MPELGRRKLRPDVKTIMDRATTYRISTPARRMIHDFYEDSGWPKDADAALEGLHDLSSYGQFADTLVRLGYQKEPCDADRALSMAVRAIIRLTDCSEDAARQVMTDEYRKAN